jgi:AhpC/TSA antioxidant enzyme
LTLTELAANEHKPLEGFGVFGVVKETGVDDQGLAEFTGFFPFPLYRDKHLDFYTALGNRNITIPLNPIKLVAGAVSLVGMQKRLNERKIEGNFKGEGIKQGGVILFDKHGSPKYAIYEKTGRELPVEDILAAVHAMKQEK